MSRGPSGSAAEPTWVLAAPAAHGAPEGGDEPTRPDAAGNWLWLVTTQPGTLLVLGPATDGLVEFARRRFAATTSVMPAAHVARSVPDASADCVVIANALESPAVDLAGTLWLLRHCRRILRPGGVCCAAAPNPLWHGLLAPRDLELGAGPRLARLARGPWRAVQRGVLPRLLRRAGFAEVRRYYVEPSLEAPRAFVPATTTAVRAYERERSRSRMRTPLIAVGLHAALFPATLFVAST